MKTNIKNFDGYKFRQAMAMATTSTSVEFFGEDYELSKEKRLETASEDTSRMWRYLWQKLKWQLS